MNSELRNFLIKNNINYKKITIKKNAKIIETNNNQYVIKDKKRPIDKIYKYLNSRSFDYYPKLLLDNDKYNIYEYINNIEIEDSEKAKDIMYLTSLLHSKTSYYKEIDINDYKELYEEIFNKLNFLNNYYLDIMSLIDKEIYMSPSHYLLARNINIIFNSLNYSGKLLDNWYKEISKKKKIRLVTIHNNLDLDNYLRNDRGYLISWDKSKIDLPIYDILNFYKKYALSLPFYNLLLSYEKIYPLLKEEKELLFSLILLPSKIEFNKREYNNTELVKKEIDYLYKSLKLYNEYLPKNSTID